MQFGGAFAVVTAAVLLLAGLLGSFTPYAGSVRASPSGITIQPVYETTSSTIVSGASLGTAVDLLGGRLVAVAMPEAWTAADLTLRGSIDGGNYYDVYDDSGNEVVVSAGVSRHVVFDGLANGEGLRWLQVRSGSAITPVAQASTRTVTFVVRP